MKRRQWLWLQQTDLSRITLEIAMSTEEKTTVCDVYKYKLQLEMLFIMMRSSRLIVIISR